MFTFADALFAQSVFSAAGHPLKDFPEFESVFNHQDTLLLDDCYIIQIQTTVQQTVGVYTKYTYEVWVHDSRVSFDIDAFDDALIRLLLEFKHDELRSIVRGVEYKSDKTMPDELPF